MYAGELFNFEKCVEKAGCMREHMITEGLMSHFLFGLCFLLPQLPVWIEWHREQFCEVGSVPFTCDTYVPENYKVDIPTVLFVSGFIDERLKLK